MEQVELDTVSKMENEGYVESQKRDDANNRGNFVPMGYNAAGETERERDTCAGGAVGKTGHTQGIQSNTQDRAFKRLYIGQCIQTFPRDEKDRSPFVIL